MILNHVEGCADCVPFATPLILCSSTHSPSMLPMSSIPFFGSGVCPWRVPGKLTCDADVAAGLMLTDLLYVLADVALVLSFPVLWYRIRTVGLSGE